MSLTSKQKQVLDSYDVTKLCDFLHVFPYRFDIIEETDERNLTLNDSVVLQGRVVTPIRSSFYAKNKSVSRFKFLTTYNEYSITIFNRPWLKTPTPDRICSVIGKLDKNNSIIASNFLFKPLDEVIGIFPVYPLKKKITQKQIRAVIKKVYSLCVASKLSFFPDSILKNHGYMSYMNAIENVHFPTNQSALNQAINTLKYVEFFQYHVNVLLASHVQQQSYKQPKKWDPLII